MKDHLEWNEKLFDLTPEIGRDALIQIFRSPDLVGDGNMILARKLQELSTPQKLDKAVREAIVRASDPGKQQSN